MVFVHPKSARFIFVRQLLITIAVTISCNGITRICIQTHSIWVHVVCKAMHRLLVVGPDWWFIIIELIFAPFSVAALALADNEHGLCGANHIYHLC